MNLGLLIKTFIFNIFMHTDLSGCDLTQIPEAVFLLMRDTALETCDLSQNLIKRIPSKLPTKFSSLTGLFFDIIFLHVVT